MHLEAQNPTEQEIRENKYSKSTYLVAACHVLNRVSVLLVALSVGNQFGLRNDNTAIGITVKHAREIAVDSGIIVATSLHASSEHSEHNQ